MSGQRTGDEVLAARWNTDLTLLWRSRRQGHDGDVDGYGASRCTDDWVRLTCLRRSTTIGGQQDAVFSHRALRV